MGEGWHGKRVSWVERVIGDMGGGCHGWKVS